MMIVLVILVVAFQINRQLYDQQQVIAGRVARTASRQIAQLQREHLRLYGMIEGTQSALDEEKFQLQRDLVQSRVNIMHNTIVTGDISPEMYELYDSYVASWQEVQPHISAWQANPQDLLLKEQITAAMFATELEINHISTLVQLAFEDRMASWADKSRFLNRLLTVGSFSFALIMVLVAYSSYLFLKNQSANQQTLRASEQRLRAILDAIPDAVYRINRAGVYTDYKPPANAADAFPQDAVLGRSIHAVMPAATAALVQDSIHAVLASGEQQLLELVLPDAHAREITYYEARLLPGGQDEVQIIARDITAVKQQEEAALQAQKLESLGVLAGGIAHDFNNLLTGMIGQASLAVAKLERGLPALTHVQKVILSAERAADLTRQLLAYTGKGKFQVGPLDINQLIRDTTSLMETALPTNATLELLLEDALPFVQSDRSQLQQVIMNLFINAIEALSGEDGAIRISTSKHCIGEVSANSPLVGNGQVVSGNSLTPGTYIHIEVTDTGSGMDQETLRRIFDPFFSTKPKGHGLGLSATLGIIRTHHGALQVQSQPTIGTTFSILLPALPETQPIQDAPLAPTVAGTANVQKTVLIVDDEAPVREVAADILAEQGYCVVAAANGYEGLDLFRARCDTIAVVLLDLKMPGLNGLQTYHELRKIQPQLKVVFTSGYSDAEVVMLTSKTDRVTFLSKPYTTESLTQQIGQMVSL
jgi:signal transduction histidine kinase